MLYEILKIFLLFGKFNIISKFNNPILIFVHLTFFFDQATVTHGGVSFFLKRTA